MGTGYHRGVALLFSWLHLVAVQASSTDLQLTNTGIGSLDNLDDNARKLFAGYRIVPKPCVGTPSSPNARDGAPGICMFNYECSQRNGELVGACMDGFLFGACCKLPPGVSFVVDLPGIDDLDINSADTNSADTPESHVTSSVPDSTHDIFLPPVLASFPSAGADTVLLHQNGTEVKDSVQNLQELLFDRPNIQEEPTGPTSRRPELTTFSYVTGPGVPVSTVKNTSTSKSPSFSTETSSSPPKPHGSTPPENLPWENILQSNAIPSDALEKSSSVKPYVTASTTYYTQPPQYTKPSFFTSTTKWHYGPPGFRPKPTTSKKPATSTDDGLIEVPLLLASSTNVPESDPNVEAATNAASINHILSILNNSEPSYLDETQAPQRNDTRPEKPVTKPTKFKPTTPGYSHLEPVLIETTPSKEIPTAAASNVVTSFTAKKPTSTTVSIHYISRPSTSKPTTTRRPPSSTSTINIHGPSLTVKPKDPVRITTPSPLVTHYSTPKPPSYTKKPAPETTFNYRPTPEPSFHYTASPNYDYLFSSSTNYPTPPPPPPSGLYGPPPSPTVGGLFTTSHYTSPMPSSSLRPPKPSAPPPVPTVIVLGPYDPVSTTYPPQSNKPTSSSHTQDSPIGNTGLMYTQIPSNNQNGHVTIITKPSRPTTVTVTKRTPITVATQSFTETPAGSTDILHYVTAYPPVVTLPPALPSENDLIAFPPVRDPNLNVTSKPTYTGDEDTEDSQYGGENTTPHLDETNLDNKVHGFVNKIVQSLQGNFQDLEQVLFNGDKANITIAKPIVFTSTTRRPTILTTVWSTLRPTRLTTRRPPPTKQPKPTPAPVPTTTKKPTTRPPPTRPPPTTTKRPTSTTRRPKPTTSTTTTKKPKPVRKPSTTTESYEEEDESTNPNSSSTGADVGDPDYRRQCGVRPHMKSGRVVGGKGASFGEWPWQVLVRESTWLGLFTKNKCGGVLITHRYVITAAHCQPGFLASLVAVFGEYDISGELEQKRSVSKNVRRVIVHRQYDAATFENDLALLELESPVQYDTHIVPICMPPDHADFTGRMATVTGWGRLKYGGGVPSVLQEVQVPVIENSVCQEMFHTSGHAKNIISSFLCAGYANGQKDSCEGDSGGPLMVEGDDGRWTLVGTVSHGIKCAAPYLPGVYMRTTYYKPWLKSITGVQ